MNSIYNNAEEEAISIAESDLQELESEENRDFKSMSNLSIEQIGALRIQLEDELKLCQEKQVKLKEEKDILEMKLVRGSIEEERLEKRRQALRIEEAHFDYLVNRINQLKSLVHRPGMQFEPSFPVSSLPQVILCSPWDDDLMPKVIVCDRPKLNKLHPGFENSFTPEQMEVISREKKWMALECGKLQIQIAGLKGEVRVVSKENDVLRAIVDTNEEKESEDPVKVNLPCYGEKGHPGGVKPCPKYQKGSLAAQGLAKPRLTVSLTSTAIPKYEVIEPTPVDVDREVLDLERRVEELQKRLNEAKEQRSELKVQQAALRCLQCSAEDC